MDKIMIKRVNANYSKDYDVENIMRYVCSEKQEHQHMQLHYWDTRGLPKNLEKAIALLKASQQYMGKDTGRRINHIVISFPETIQDVTLVYIIANHLADYLGKEYTLIYGIHTDTNHLHIHFALNTISYRTGKKFHTNQKEFAEWKRQILIQIENILVEWKI